MGNGKKPFVGALVLYRPSKTDVTFHDMGHKPYLPALITFVWDETCNLCVFRDEPHGPAWVAAARQGDDIGCWNWASGQPDAQLEKVLREAVERIVRGAPKA